MKKGKFLVLEGISLCPKQNCTDYIKNLILETNPDSKISLFREPQINQESEKKELEEILFFMKENPYNNVSRAMEFFVENRRKHNHLISYEIESGNNVILDRYWHSNFAFQGAQGISLEKIADANRGLQIPDLTFVFERGTPEKKDEIGIFKAKVESYYRSLGYLLPSLIGDKSVRYIVADRGRQTIESQIEPLIRREFGYKK